MYNIGGTQKMTMHGLHGRCKIRDTNVRGRSDKRGQSDVRG